MIRGIIYKNINYKKYITGCSVAQLVKYFYYKNFIIKKVTISNIVIKILNDYNLKIIIIKF